ncbi:hypothetical protein ACI782_05480 [Geodermatophilus sp. SYSU D00703]
MPVSTTVRVPDATKPTMVLVHGAFADSSRWHGVIVHLADVVTVQDLAVPARAQRFMAGRARSQTVEAGASHAVTVSQPGAVARLIDEAARAAAG